MVQRTTRAAAIVKIGKAKLKAKNGKPGNKGQAFDSDSDLGLGFGAISRHSKAGLSIRLLETFNEAV
jgi:hypothetical protein